MSKVWTRYPLPATRYPQTSLWTIDSTEGSHVDPDRFRFEREAGRGERVARRTTIRSESFCGPRNGLLANVFLDLRKPGPCGKGRSRESEPTLNRRFTFGNARFSFSTKTRVPPILSFLSHSGTVHIMPRRWTEYLPGGNGDKGAVADRTSVLHTLWIILWTI